MKPYNKAPLPFQGQKRNFIKQFREVIKNYPNIHTVVDLFGGSGLLSHNVKRIRPELKMIYNDFDNYRWRLEQIPRTNEIIKHLQTLTSKIEKKQKLPDEIKLRVIEYLENENEKQPIDILTIQSFFVFSGKSACSLAELSKQTLYSNVVKTEYNADGYLDGLEIVSKDYKELIEQYKDDSGVLFLVDPPYLFTDCKRYNMNFWSIKDSLGILTLLINKKYIYFTSDKTNLIELCEWVGEITGGENPIANATKFETTISINNNGARPYTDIMLVK